MSTTDLGRRLAAIMFADRVGYSAMVPADEDHAKSQRERMRAMLGLHYFPKKHGLSCSVIRA